MVRRAVQAAAAARCKGLRIEGEGDVGTGSDWREGDRVMGKIGMRASGRRADGRAGR
jgi:hypothetical protein